MGGPAHGYVMTATLLDELVGALVDPCWGEPTRGLPGSPSAGLSGAVGQRFAQAVRISGRVKDGELIGR